MGINTRLIKGLSHSLFSLIVGAGLLLFFFSLAIVLFFASNFSLLMNIIYFQLKLVAQVHILFLILKISDKNQWKQ